MIRVEPATFADILFVLGNASAITAREIERAGATDWQTMKFFWENLKRGEARTVRVDGKIGFVMGITQDKQVAGQLNLWFISTEEYWRLGARGVRYGQFFVQSMRNAYPRRQILARTWSDHSSVGRWFALLGFELRFTKGLSRYFELTLEAKSKDDSLFSI